MAHAGSDPVSTGIEGLDEILRGGLPPAKLHLMQGEPGVGKTTAALQFLMAGAPAGERCLYVTLSQTRAELEGIAASHGWSLNGIRIEELAGRMPSQVQPTRRSSKLPISGSTKRGWLWSARLKSINRIASSMTRCSRFVYLPATRRASVAN
jgi:archaellum biogenesis ATPase FlaH